MTIYDFSMYVNQDVDDTFTTEEIARWFNKAVAHFNLIPPVTKYPFISMDIEDTENVDEFVASIDDADPSDGYVGAYGKYPMTDTFMLAVMLPYVISAVKAQESSLQERQLVLQDFMANAKQYKSSENISTYLKNQQNGDLDLYQLGENVYLTDFTTAPFAGEWNKASAYKEVTFFKDNTNTVYKVVDDSKVDEDWQAIIDEQEV
jgi:hypothetical protein